MRSLFPFRPGTSCSRVRIKYEMWLIQRLVAARYKSKVVEISIFTRRNTSFVRGYARPPVVASRASVLTNESNFSKYSPKLGRDCCIKGYRIHANLHSGAINVRSIAKRSRIVHSLTSEATEAKYLRCAQCLHEDCSLQNSNPQK